MPPFAYLLVLVVGLVAGFVGRKLRPNHRINPGLVALGCVLLTLVVHVAVVAFAVRGGAEPGLVGYLMGLVIGRAGIPLVIAGMLAAFMND